jgi:WYL domain-containing protein
MHRLDLAALGPVPMVVGSPPFGSRVPAVGREVYLTAHARIAMPEPLALIRSNTDDTPNHSARAGMARPAGQSRQAACRRRRGDPVIAAWCELRQDFRHFRVDRIASARVLDDRFTSESARLTAEWMALSKERRELPV